MSFPAIVNYPVKFTEEVQIPKLRLPRGSVRNADLADMAEGTVKGRALDAGDGPPADLTGAELAAIVGSALQLAFAYGDATPATVGLALAGSMVESVQVIITTAFNGAGASLTVGDIGNASRLLAATENNPAEVATYRTHPGYTYGVDTSVRLTITPGAGASAGAGLVVITLR